MEVEISPEPSLLERAAILAALALEEEERRAPESAVEPSDSE